MNSFWRCWMENQMKEGLGQSGIMSSSAHTKSAGVTEKNEMVFVIEGNDNSDPIQCICAGPTWHGPKAMLAPRRRFQFPGMPVSMSSLLNNSTVFSRDDNPEGIEARNEVGSNQTIIS
ncbi:uncharacterized protein [Miscanthus floridulus]|uniref:uncharacterized protein n=1 Tax=Miscanthus floridulus TaxID=154761 RepID=UPI003458BD5D